MRIALLIQYDGTAYHGWQVQKATQTVQGVLENILAELYGRRVCLVASGRTDSGVHALGQVAHFDLPAELFPVERIANILNRRLPADIHVLASRSVSAEFHSRFSAIRRDYRYTLSGRRHILRRNHQWQVRFPFDPEVLQQLAVSIRGQHDFSSFCYAGTETENMICKIEHADWQSGPDGAWLFNIRGDRFLHHMVRMLVGTMYEVARGKWPMSRFKELLLHPNRQSHVVTAPALGLVLEQVGYPEKIAPDWGTAGDSVTG